MTLLALTDHQLNMILHAAAPLPVNARDRFLRSVACRRPVNDSDLATAIADVLATNNFAIDGDGSMLLVHQTKEGISNATAA
jgi:hypothetical protein